MTFSVFVPPHAPGARLPVVWWLSSLTCTHANVTEKGEYRRTWTELGLVFVATDTSPRGDGVPDDPEGAFDFGLGAASTSMQPSPRSRPTIGWGPTSPRKCRHWSPGTFRLTPSDSRSWVIQWAATAPWSWGCLSPAGSGRCRPLRQSWRRPRSPGGERRSAATWVRMRRSGEPTTGWR